MIQELVGKQNLDNDSYWERIIYRKRAIFKERLQEEKSTFKSVHQLLIEQDQPVGKNGKKKRV